MRATHWLLLAVAIVALTAMYLLARPLTPVEPPPAAVAQTPAAAAPAAPVTAREFEFDVAQGKVIGPPQLQVNQNERVILRVRSDVADELHVHGYDLSAPLPAGEQVSLTFVAGRSGRFEVELHGAHRELGALEVQPR